MNRNVNKINGLLEMYQVHFEKPLPIQLIDVEDLESVIMESIQFGNQIASTDGLESEV